MLGRRRRRDDPVESVDPGALGPRWSGAVQRALDARGRVAALVERAPEGPRRGRLTEIASKVDAGVLAAWHTAQRADQLTLTVGGLDVGRITSEHKQAKRDVALAEARGVVPLELAERAEVLAERHAAAHRLLNALDDAEQRLGLIDARLESAVVRVAEVALHEGGADRADALDAELASMADDLEALRAALDELA